MSTATARRRRRHPTEDAATQRLNVRINPESYRRLMLHCLMNGTTPGKLLEELIEGNLRDYHVTRSRRGESSGAVDLPAEGRSVDAAA